MIDEVKIGEQLGKIVVVGSGLDAWVTAIGLARTLQDEAPLISVISHGNPEHMPISSAEDLRVLHAILGLDEAWVLGLSRGAFKLGGAYSGWYEADTSFFSPFAQYGALMDGVPFQHYWVKARHLGQTYAVTDFSLAALAAQDGRFAFPQNDTSSLLSTLSYGLHLDGKLYCDMLRKYAISVGVSVVDEQVTRVDVKQDKAGFVKCLHLENGQVISADLFIDATQTERFLIEKTLGASFQSWRDVLFCDRMMVYNAAAQGIGEPYTSAVAMPGGWVQRVPLNGQNGYTLYYHQASLPDDEAASLLTRQGGSVYSGQCSARSYRPGRMAQAWVKNCVAVGRAAGEIEDLGASRMKTLQACVTRLVALLPDKTCRNGESAEYNRLVGGELDKIRGFVQFHYQASRRTDGEIWRASKTCALSDDMQSQLNLFQCRGSYKAIDDDPFTQTEWISALLGYGNMPQTYHPLVDEMKDDNLIGLMEKMRQGFQTATRSMLPHQNFVTQVLEDAKKRMQ